MICVLLHTSKVSLLTILCVIVGMVASMDSVFQCWLGMASALVGRQEPRSSQYSFHSACFAGVPT